MKVVYKKRRKKFRNGKFCLAFEYPMGDKDIDGAVIELNGRYPEKGRVVNLECKEMAYVIKGSGKLVVDGKKFSLGQGDLVLVDPAEKYFWEGTMTLFVSSTPAWYPKQHKAVK